MSNTISKVFSPIGKLLSKIRSRRGGLPMLAIACIVLVVFVIISTRPEVKPIPRPEKVWVVEALTALHQDIQPSLKLYGIVVAGRESELRAMVAGNVVAVGENFKDGAQVSAGDLLVEIDPFEYEISLAEKKASLAEASSRLELLKRDLKRAKKLFKKNDASRQFLDTAQLNLDQQQAIVNQRAIGVKRAERDLQQTKLIAPYDGILSGVSAQVGKRINTNEKVASVVDNKRLEALFSLSNDQYGRILEQDGTVIGRPIEFSWHVGDKTITNQATIERVAANIAFGTGGIDIHATITNPDAQTLLRPGAFIRVNVPDRSYKNVISIPEQSLYGKDTIFVIRDDRLVAQTIEVIGYDGNNLLVKSKDGTIADGEPILTTQIREGGTGIKVRIAKLNESTVRKPVMIADEAPVKDSTELIQNDTPDTIDKPETNLTTPDKLNQLNDNNLTNPDTTDPKITKINTAGVK